MKKILYTIVCFLLIGTTTTFAQFEKKNWMIGGTGNLGFNTEKIDGTDERFNSFSIGLQPKIGYFMADRLAIGAGIDIDYTNLDGSGASNITLAPFVRYYVNNFFGEVNVGLISTNYEGFDGDSDLLLSLGVGYSYFITDAVAIEPIADISFGGGFGIDILAGFQIYLDRIDRVFKGRE